MYHIGLRNDAPYLRGEEHAILGDSQMGEEGDFLVGSCNGAYHGEI